MSEELALRIDKLAEVMEQRFDANDSRFDAIDRRFDAIDKRFEAVDSRFGAVDGRIEELDRHMHVLHEEVIARIAAIKEYDGPSKAEFAQGMADLRESIGRRLAPLEALGRDHEKRIGRLERRRS